MSPELMRRRIVKREMRIVCPPYKEPPPITSVGTKELEKILSTINCFLWSEPETPYTEGYIMLRKDLEQKLSDRRFSG